MKYYLGIDIGGTSIKYGIVSEYGDIIEKDKLEVPIEWNGLMELCVRLFRSFSNKYKIEGIGIGSPGTVNTENGYITGKLADTLRYIIDHSFFELKFKIDVPIAVEQDSKCAGLGEYWKGNMKGIKNAVFLILGSGLGGAIFINGSLYKGYNLSAGDIGYSFRSSTEQYNLSQLIAPVSVEKRFFNLTGKHLTIPDMYHIQEEDAIAKQVYQDFIMSLANIMYTIQFVVDPEIFVIGGGISKWSILQDEVRKALSTLNEQRNDPIMPRIALCKHHNDANILGAVYNLIFNK